MRGFLHRSEIASGSEPIRPRPSADPSEDNKEPCEPDPDGTVVTYTWDFDDGGGASGASVGHAFSVPGEYTATLTVTDSSGLTETTTVAVQVLAANIPPTAVVSTWPTSGTAPLVVQFSGAGFSDTDGTVVSWQWVFGDGTSGSGVSVSHTYAAAGSYTATLTGIDDWGATATASPQVGVQSNPSKIVRVTSIQMAVVPNSGSKVARATVLIPDLTGAPVSGATVSGSWIGGVTGTSSGTTDVTGALVLSSKKFKRGMVTFRVTNVAKRPTSTTHIRTW